MNKITGEILRADTDEIHRMDYRTLLAARDFRHWIRSSWMNGFRLKPTAEEVAVL